MSLRAASTQPSAARSRLCDVLQVGMHKNTHDEPRPTIISPIQPQPLDMNNSLKFYFGELSPTIKLVLHVKCADSGAPPTVNIGAEMIERARNGEKMEMTVRPGYFKVFINREIKSADRLDTVHEPIEGSVSQGTKTYIARLKEENQYRDGGSTLNALQIKHSTKDKWINVFLTRGEEVTEIILPFTA
jgi:hypothetical protein